jgi:hypothetical protein
VTVTDWGPDGVPGVEIGVGGFGFAGEELQPETDGIHCRYQSRPRLDAPLPDLSSTPVADF